MKLNIIINLWSCVKKQTIHVASITLHLCLPPPICIAKNMTRDENRKHLYDIRGSLSNITFILIYGSYMSC